MDDLANKRENDKGSSGLLLEPQERLVCEQITVGQPPYSQRAQFLLAIDAGVTQRAAALQSEQTVGQVSYWLGKFRRDRMGIFPPALLLPIELEGPPSQQLTGTPTPSESLENKQDASMENEISAAAEAKREKKEKAKKKSKKVKASKKSKKGKKKQAKKSKKRKKKSDRKK
jgi:hypothetical protein